MSCRLKYHQRGRELIEDRMAAAEADQLATHKAEKWTSCAVGDLVEFTRFSCSSRSSTTVHNHKSDMRV